MNKLIKAAVKAEVKKRQSETGTVYLDLFASLEKRLLRIRQGVAASRHFVPELMKSYLEPVCLLDKIQNSNNASE